MLQRAKCPVFAPHGLRKPHNRTRAVRAMCALLSEQGAGVALRIAPYRRSSALTAVGAWEVRIVVELGVLRMYAIS